MFVIDWNLARFLGNIDFVRKCKTLNIENLIIGALYRLANDPGLQMIPVPQMIPKLCRKWSQDRKWCPDCTVNDPGRKWSLRHKIWKCEDSGIWTVDLKFMQSVFFITVKLRKPWLYGFDSKRLIGTKPIIIKFRTREKTTKPQLIGHVWYINILTSIRGFRVKIAIF